MERDWLLWWTIWRSTCNGNNRMNLIERRVNIRIPWNIQNISSGSLHWHFRFVQFPHNAWEGPLKGTEIIISLSTTNSFSIRSLNGTFIGGNRKIEEHCISAILIWYRTEKRGENVGGSSCSFSFFLFLFSFLRSEKDFRYYFFLCSKEIKLK